MLKCVQIYGEVFLRLAPLIQGRGCGLLVIVLNFFSWNPGSTLINFQLSWDY